MSRRASVLLIGIISLAAFAQTPSSKYQRGTIMAVTAHQNSPTDAQASPARYEVKVRIGNTDYVVLYTPPNGANGVEYSPGTDMLFLVGEDRLTFNSKLSGTTSVPILRREELSDKAAVDWSKASGQYFSMKLQNLTQTLDLSDEQQAKIKPALEQETGEVSQILKNPALTRNEKLERFEKIVRSSDAKMKPVLSSAQLQKLEQLRHEQRENVKTFVAQENPVERH